MGNNICIIPARGGSKRIPRKNIKKFLGKPIIAYSIEAALASNLFSEVMVSTDDEEIATIAMHYGASVPFKRSLESAGDYATTTAVLTEVLQEYKKRKKVFELGCCIYPTAPFSTSQKLKEAISLLQDKQYDSVFPILPYSYPIQRALKVNVNNKMALFNPENLNKRSQDLVSSYHDSGQFYCFRIQQFITTEKIITDNTGAIFLTEMEAHDIDNLEDWEVAEFKYEILRRKLKGIRN